MSKPELPGERAAEHGGVEHGGAEHDNSRPGVAEHNGTEHGGADEAEAGQVEYAEHAEHAEFAEFAEHAEFAEFAEHAEHVDHPAAADQGGDGAAQEQHHGHLLGHHRPDGQSDLLWRNEMLHVLDQAAKSLQSAGVSRLHRQDRPEPRWPVSAAVVVAIVFQRLLPSEFVLRPAYLHYLLFALEGALLIGLFAANPVRIERRSRPIRTASIALIVLITAGNAASAVLLIKAIVSSQASVSGQNAAIHLLLSGAAIWGTNVIAFALWYWEFDRGGPVNRLEGTSPYPDLMFPQMTTPELTPQGWGPRFVDYLYLSFTNATAFSPTDVMPMARWAKMTMLVQSAVSLALGALVIARAINIL
jgi:uncharacterized membrane protein